MTPCIDHGLKGNPQGYGRFWSSELGSKELAHRQVFRRATGDSPEAVLHTCDNPRCINLDHLVGGTRADNNKDRAAKGRSAKTRAGLRKLTEDDANSIRARYVPRIPGPKPNPNGVMALAREFCVDANVIYNIVRGNTYE